MLDESNFTPEAIASTASETSYLGELILRTWISAPSWVLVESDCAKKISDFSVSKNPKMSLHGSNKNIVLLIKIS